MIWFKVYIACKRKSFSDCCEIFCVKDDWRSQICYRGDTKEVLQGSHTMHETIKKQTIKKELIFVPRVVHIWCLFMVVVAFIFCCCYRQIAVFHISSQISDVSCVSVLRNIKSLSIFIGCIELYFLLYRYQLQLFSIS